MKKQRFIHPIIFVGQLVGITIAVPYLPPWMIHNPGIGIILAVLLSSELAHMILHDK